MFKELPKVILLFIIISYSFDLSRINSFNKRLTAIEKDIEILNDNQK
jgi:hypothetical protein